MDVKVRFGERETAMFTVAKILLPTDFSAPCIDVLRIARPVAARFGSKLVLFHVLPQPAILFLLGGDPNLREARAKIRAEAERKLEEFSSAELHPMTVKRVLVEGDPAAAIIDYARSEQIDLIMMPTHGYGLFRRLLLGSVTAKVLHDANCPVWTTVHAPESGTEPDSWMPHRIACAIDLGPQSAHLLTWASRLAWEFGVSLSLIHVITALDPRFQDYYLSPEWRGHLINAAQSEIAKLKQTTGLNAEIFIEIGDIPSAVAAAVTSAQADLLIIGRSHDGLGGRLPKNAYAIIRESPCPVLSV